MVPEIHGGERDGDEAADDRLVDEADRESFPASDPPSSWSGGRDERDR